MILISFVYFVVSFVMDFLFTPLELVFIPHPHS